MPITGALNIEIIEIGDGRLLARVAESALPLNPNGSLHGGTLHNKVVHRVAATLHELGAGVLRFNFRGAGKSEGVHDEGGGELEDARAALNWMRERFPGARFWLAGFSFGSWVALLAARQLPVQQMISIAPPVGLRDFSGVLAPTCPNSLPDRDGCSEVPGNAQAQTGNSRMSDRVARRGHACIERGE